jgi:hypothetical protein
MKVKLDERDSIRLKSFYIAKVKRQPTEWERIFANHMPDKD